MKNLFIYVFFFISLFALIYVIYSRFLKNDFIDNVEINRKPTQISVDRYNVDVGKVFQRELAIGEYWIKNVGLNELVISNVKVSCSCSSIIEINKIILPNDSSKIIIQYNKKINGYFFSDVLVHGNFSGSPKILSFEGFYLGED
jgi:hypothetical protein